jgi:hypothetical protein
MNKATKIEHGKYEYRGFIITQGCRGERWQIMWRDVHGWLAAGNTLRQAKERVDHWYYARKTGKRMAQQFAEAVDRVLASSCDRNETTDCPQQHLCRHGIEGSGM